MADLEYPHEPVLVNEVVKHLVSEPQGVYVDGTAGTGGHSSAIGKVLAEKGRLICLDRDSYAVRVSKKRLAFLGDKVCVVKASYADLDIVLNDLGLQEVDGVLLDLGMSSYQLDKSGRGFSFNRDEPLDMRMDLDDKLTACEMVNNLSQKELENILRNFGEEKRARSIVKAIIRERDKEAIKDSLRLAAVVKSACPPNYHVHAKHPATRTFQALRIAVNRELRNLEIFLEKVPSLLARGGRLVILSYHSLEDRLVKRAMQKWEKGCTCPPDFPYCVCGKAPVFRRLFKKGLKPDLTEIGINPRARSANLRVAERI